MEKNEDRETKRWKQAPPIARYFQKGNIQDTKTSKAFIEGVFLYRPFVILSLNEGQRSSPADRRQFQEMRWQICSYPRAITPVRAIPASCRTAAAWPFPPRRNTSTTLKSCTARRDQRQPPQGTLRSWGGFVCFRLLLSGCGYGRLERHVGLGDGDRESEYPDIRIVRSPIVYGVFPRVNCGRNIGGIVLSVRRVMPGILDADQRLGLAGINQIVGNRGLCETIASSTGAYSYYSQSECRQRL